MKLEECAFQIALFGRTGEMTEGEGTQFGLSEASLQPTPQQLAASEAITLVCTPHAQHIPTCHPGNSSEVSHCAL